MKPITKLVSPSPATKATLLKVAKRHLTFWHGVILLSVIAGLIYVHDRHLTVAAFVVKGVDLFCDVVTDRVFPARFLDLDGGK